MGFSHYPSAILVQDDVLYIGYRGDIFKKDLRTGSEMLIHGEDEILAIMVWDNILYMGFKGFGGPGVGRFNMATGEHLESWDDDNGLESNFVTSITVWEDVIYIGQRLNPATGKGGVSRYDLKEDDFKEALKESNGLESNHVYSLAVWDDVVYIGHRSVQQKVSRFMISDDQDTVDTLRLGGEYDEPLTITTGSRKMEIWDEILYIGGLGVTRFNLVSGEFEETWNATNGYPNLYINDLTANSEFIYMAMPNGMARFNLANDEFEETWTVEDGLGHNATSAIGLWKEFLFVGNMDGLSHFHKDTPFPVAGFNLCPI